MNTASLIMFMMLSSGILTVVIELGVLIWSIRYLAKAKKDENSLQQIKIYSDLFNSTEDINKILDTFVKETFNEYMIFHPELIQKPIINSEEQEKIRKEVVAEIRHKMSPAFYSQLCLVFREDEILSIILKKTTIILVDFCRDHNYNVDKMI